MPAPVSVRVLVPVEPLRGGPPRASLAAALVVAFGLLTGCGGSSPNPTQTGSFICTNNLTGLCEACPGVAVCVDPVTCLLTTCVPGGDIAFGVDTGPGDTGEADATSSDATAGDMVAGDMVAGDMVAGDSAADVMSDDGYVSDGTDTAATDTGVDAACVEGTKNCADKATPQFCFQGKWMQLATCGSGYTCEQGACACAGECVALGQQACMPGIAAFRTCQLDGSCLKWGVPLACQPGQICEGGQCKVKSGCSPACGAGQVCQQGACVPASSGTCTPACSGGQVCEQGKCVVKTCTPACATGQVCKAGTCEPAATGTLECGQIMACVNQFSQGPKDTVNIDACVAKGTTAAQAEYKKRKACIALSCQTLIDAGKASEAMLCVYTYCPKEQTGCLGSGTKDCSTLGGCLSGCGTSEICTIGCHADASVDGIKGWYLLSTCGEQKCAGITGNAYVTCVVQSCVASYQACYGATGGGGYSCAQVLQCAGSCTSQACAQDCKAKASSQGLIDLNALLACNNGPCGTYCTSGTQQQCDACMKINCSAQQAKCN